jgi:hypothetical protein
LRVQEKCGFKIKTIAFHGDFVNRMLKVSNLRFITPGLLAELGIDFECHDERLVRSYDIRLSDSPYPIYFTPSNPFDAVREGHRVIFLLSHPRHWHVAPVENSLDNLRRVLESVKYQCS